MIKNNIPNTIRATVDPRFLEKVDRVFDASPRTVFDELLQNSRRAGAERVDLYLERGDKESDPLKVRFTDDGEGIESPRPLLCLAGSDWSEQTAAMEDPAGMGFFCLSNFEEVLVRSHNWMVILTPAVFRGQEQVEVLRTAKHRRGLTIAWEWPDKREAELETAMRLAADYCGVSEVCIHDADGSHEEIEPVGFLEDCEMVKDLPDLGVSIGLYKDTFSAYYASGHAPSIHLNFHGVRVNLSPFDETGMEHLRALDKARAIIRVDVKDTNDLPLVLPARNALKHTAARDALVHECERLIYEYEAQLRSHSYPYEVYRRALDEFGVDIGEAQSSLSSAMRSTRYDPDGEKVLMRSELRAPMVAMAVEKCLEGASSSIALRKPNPDMEGYSWYNNLRSVDSVKVSIDGGEYESLNDYIANAVELHPERDPSDLFEWVDSIRIAVTITDPGGGEEVFTCELTALVTGTETVSIFTDVLTDPECVVFVCRSAGNDPKAVNEVPSLITRALYYPSGQDDESAADQELNEFESEATAEFLWFTGDDIGASRHRLQRALEDSNLSDVAGDEMVWSMHYDASLDQEVQIFGPHRAREAGERRVRVVCIPGGGLKSPWPRSYELVSSTPVTKERVLAFLEAQTEFKPEEDSFFMMPSSCPTSLDEWEEKNTTGS